VGERGPRLSHLRGKRTQGKTGGNKREHGLWGRKKGKTEVHGAEVNEEKTKFSRNFRRKNLRVGST